MRSDYGTGVECAKTHNLISPPQVWGGIKGEVAPCHSRAGGNPFFKQNALNKAFLNFLPFQSVEKLDTLFFMVYTILSYKEDNIMPYPPTLTEDQRLQLTDTLASVLITGVRLQTDLARTNPKLLKCVANERLPMFVFEAGQLEQLLLGFSKPFCQFEMADGSCCVHQQKTTRGFCLLHSMIKCKNCSKPALKECKNHRRPICDKCKDCGQGHSACWGFAI